MEYLQESNQKFQKTFNGKEKIMDISIVPVSRVFKTYQGQARIAELNSKNPVKRVQGQRDRVSISKEARTALTSHTQGQSPELEPSSCKPSSCKPRRLRRKKMRKMNPSHPQYKSFSI